MNDKEKSTVSKMIRIYCRSKHEQLDILCLDCLKLEDYAHKRLENCPFGENKPVCKKCRIHCYKTEYKEKTREVMRFSGPRMLLHHPIDAIKHLSAQLSSFLK